MSVSQDEGWRSGRRPRLSSGWRRPPSGPAGGVPGAAPETSRPVTRGGLGLKTAATGGRNRAVMDKSYFMGVLRTKVSEMTSEIRRMASESQKMGKDQDAFVLYDKRAKEKAADLRGIQGELADYNTLVEIMNMDSEQSTVDKQTASMQAENEQASAAMDQLYLARKKKEEDADAAQKDIEKEQLVIDKVFNEMSASMKKKFEVLKKKTAEAEKTIEEIGKEMDDLDLKVLQHMDVINASTMKKEAFSLNSKLEELETKKEELTEAVNKQETPDEERERLLREVKENNEAIETMERQVTALLEEMSNANDALDDMDESSSSSDSDPGDPLAAQQTTIDPEEIMNQLGEEKSDEEKRVLQLEVQIVTVLQKMSAALQSSADHSGDDDGLKDNEDWQRLMEVERQVYSEMDSLKSDIQRKRDDAAKFADLDGFKKECEARQGDLHKEHVSLSDQVKNAKAEYDTAENNNKKMQRELNNDETFSKLEHLERKLASLEGNNFQLKDTAAERRATGEYEPVRDQTLKIVGELNKKLIDAIKNNQIPT